MKILTDNRIFRRLAGGFLIWLVPFIASIPFYGSGGILLIDQMLFKSIMIVVGSITAAAVMVWYFSVVRTSYTADAVLTGVLWLFENWALDSIVLVGLLGMAPLTYVNGIGVRYLMIPAIVIAAGMIADGAMKKDENTSGNGSVQS
jgi:hypothetical protein